MILIQKLAVALICIFLCFGCTNTSNKPKDRNSRIDEKIIYVERIIGALEANNKAFTDTLESTPVNEREILCDARSLNPNLKANVELLMNQIYYSVAELNEQSQYLSEEQKNRINNFTPRIKPLTNEPTLCHK